jgi:uncharacterized membrane protein YccC
METNVTYTESRHQASHRFSWNIAAVVNGELFGAVVFSLKTFGAALLALFIAFWLGLDDPRWSLLTVYIVSQPDSGLVLAKSFYRMLGTIGGVLITVALVFALSQYGELFLASLAVWIGLCNFAARAIRNFASYGTQLAGYTLAIVGIPAALNPAGAYPLILARFTEIALGIGCAALVSRVVFPGELAAKLLARTREFVLDAKRFADTAIQPEADHQRLDAEMGRLATDFGAVEAMRSSAFFESADARLRNESLRRVAYAATELCIVAGEVRTRSGDTNHVGATAVSQARDKLLEAEAAFDHGQIIAAGDGSRRRPWSDPVAAALTGIRAALAVAITASFWFATAWPNGPTAVVVAAVICTLIASIEQPGKISVALGVTVLIAAVPAYVTQFYLLPYSVDFASMAFALAPVLLTCGFIMAQPKIGPLGLLAAVYFAFASNIDNVMTYDATSFLNSSLAILVGIGVAATLFSLFFPETPTAVFRRFGRQLSARLSNIAAGAQASPQSVGIDVYERLAATLPKVKSEPALERDCLVASAVALSSARAMLRLRKVIATDLPPGIVAELSSLLAGLSRTYADPSQARLIADAWRARALCRLSRIAASSASAGGERDAVNETIFGCGMLQRSLLRARTLMRETRHVR